MKKEKRQPRKAAHSVNRKKKKVSQQTEFLETVLESLTHPFYVIDAETYAIKMANSAARLGRLTGTTTCYALTHRKKRPCGTEAHPCPLEIVKKTKKPVTVEHVHYNQDGKGYRLFIIGRICSLSLLGDHDSAAQLCYIKKGFKLSLLLTDKVLELALKETAKSLPGRSNRPHQIVNG